MRTLIADGHTRDVVGHRIAQIEATTVCTVLRAVEHIPLTADVAFDGSVFVRPQRELSTPEWVTVMRAFCAVSDSPIVRLGAVASANARLLLAHQARDEVAPC